MYSRIYQDTILTKFLYTGPGLKLHTQQNIQNNLFNEDLNTDEDILRCLVAGKICMNKIPLHQNTSQPKHYVDQDFRAGKNCTLHPD